MSSVGGENGATPPTLCPAIAGHKRNPPVGETGNPCLLWLSNSGSCSTFIPISWRPSRNHQSSNRLPPPIGQSLAQERNRGVKSNWWKQGCPWRVIVARASHQLPPRTCATGSESVILPLHTALERAIGIRWSHHTSYHPPQFPHSRKGLLRGWGKDTKLKLL